MRILLMRFAVTPDSGRLLPTSSSVIGHPRESSVLFNNPLLSAGMTA
jgi:hypothetical protein